MKEFSVVWNVGEQEANPFKNETGQRNLWTIFMSMVRFPYTYTVGLSLTFSRSSWL